MIRCKGLVDFSEKLTGISCLLSSGDYIVSMVNTAKTWDPSTIGIDSDDMGAMDTEEQVERAVEEINRAADIMQAVVDAFHANMTPAQRAEIREAARMAIRVAREIDGPIT